MEKQIKPPRSAPQYDVGPARETLTLPGRGAIKRPGVMSVFMFALGIALGRPSAMSVLLWLTLACLVTLPVLWFVAARHARVIRPAHRRNRELVDTMVRVVDENLQGVQVIKGFAREPQEI